MKSQTLCRKTGYFLAAAFVFCAAALGKQPPGQTSEIEPTEQFLLLANDRVLVGTIVEQPDGYLLRRSGGTIVIPKTNAVLLADSLLALYEFKRQQMPDHDVDEHWKLCQWCCTNRLYEQAEYEAKRVLELDPRHVGASRRLRSLRKPASAEDSRESDRSATYISQSTAPDPSAVVGTFIRAHGQATFDLFTTIERRLINSCASCHTAKRYKGTFRLYRRDDNEPNDQRFTARNLQSVLDAIDLQRPDQSPILRLSIQAHGPARLPPYGGPNDPAYRELFTFVSRVYDGHKKDSIIADDAGKEPRPEAIAQSRSRRPETKPQRRIAPEFDDRPGDDVSPIGRSGAAADDSPDPDGANWAGRRSRPGHSQAAKDPFDPQEFNRRWGAQQRGSATEDRLAEAPSASNINAPHSSGQQSINDPDESPGTAAPAKANKSFRIPIRLPFVRKSAAR
jgi:hypothetical protein